jgi:hypothetical protein
MAIIEEALQNGGVRYNGGQNAPIGSFWAPLSNCIFQQTSDGALPKCGTFIAVTTSGSSTLAACATAINALVNGLGYTASSLHAYTTGDLVQVPGQAANDA